MLTHCQINSAVSDRERVFASQILGVGGLMTAPELVVLIGIIAAFATFAAVLAWVSRGAGKPVSSPNAIPARANLRGRVDQIGRTSSA
jgi:hypothetical protein